MIIVAYYKIINKTKESVKLTKVGQRKVGELDPLAVFRYMPACHATLSAFVVA